MNELYTDGGVIRRNPSPYGLTYAVRRVDNGVVVMEHACALPPYCIGTKTATNNNAELYALCHGLLTLPETWEGRVHSDSQCALGWIFLDYKPDTIPDAMMEDYLRARMLVRRRIGQVTFRLLQGHPTQADLAAGFGKKRGLPVSEHNVWCDKACQAAGKAYWLRISDEEAA